MIRKKASEGVGRPRAGAKPSSAPVTTTIRALRPDPRNANKGTQQGGGMVEKSLRACGAGRSILIDKHGVVIAGNKTLESAASIGIEDTIVVQSDGTKLVVVQRTDLDLATDPRARELAIFDNRAGEVGLDWNVDVLREFVAEGLDLKPYEFDAKMMKEIAGGGTGDVANQAVSGTFLVVITCADEPEQVQLLDRFVTEGLTCKALVS